jgi:predicted MFS family arabinose efflux permease
MAPISKSHFSASPACLWLPRTLMRRRARMTVAVGRSGDAGIWRPALAGLCATLVGIGLARFAYTPLIPALIAAGWFTPAQAVYLGAANLAGYLAGALLARPVAARIPPPVALRTMMALATLAFFACATPLSFLWFFVWRFAAGLAGGTLMVLAAPTVMPHIPPARYGLVGGVIFTGVGLGIALSGTAVPLLLRAGLAVTWCGLGALALVLTLLSWRAWPDAPRLPAAPARAAAPCAPGGIALKALYFEYALNAAGLVPHMVFLVDFVARGLDQGLAAGAQQWVLFGLGALAGPVLAGHLADRIGFGPALRLAFLAQAAAVALPVFVTHPAWLGLSSVVGGVTVPGVAPLVLGRVRELVGIDAAARAWSFATTAFAIGQALAAYGLSFAFAQGGSYGLLFALGSAAPLLALLLDLTLGRSAGRRRG